MIFKPNTRFIHLADIDLDGYGCQFLTNEYLSNNSKMDEYISSSSFFNCRVSDQDRALGEIFSLILSDKSKPAYLLITDLGFNLETCHRIANFIKSNENIDIDVYLIDHHKTSQPQADIFPWFHLDLSKCSSYLCSDWVINNFKKFLNASEISYIHEFGKFVNSHDLFLTEDPWHHQANFLSDAVFSKVFYPDFLISYKHEHLLFIIGSVFDQFFVEKKTIFDVESAFPQILNNFLNGKIDPAILSNPNIPTEHKLYFYFSILFESVRNDFPLIHIDGVVSLMFFNLDSGIFQYFSHYLLVAHPEIDLLFNLKKAGNMSFRSQDNIDSTLIASKYFNGGGHPQASGGKIKLERVFSLSDAHKEIAKHISEVQSTAVS